MRVGKTTTSFSPGQGECRGVIFDDLRALIESRLPSSSRATGSGFLSFKCPICNDYKPRAGIKIDHTAIGFNCFNCSARTKFEDGQCFLSKNLERVIIALGVDQDELNGLKFKLLKSSLGDTSAIESEVKIDGITTFRSPPQKALPSELMTLTAAITEGHEIGIEAAQYLLDVRKMPIDPDQIYVTANSESKWWHRVTFPVTMWGRNVGFTGRSWDKEIEPKYHTIGNKGTMLFNFDVAHSHPCRPLFITEGPFDALRVNGVALMGNVVSAHQQHWLDKINRPKILVPDRGKDGYVLIEQAVNLGWGVALPDLGSNKDVDAAACKYGKIYVMREVMSNVHYEDAALMKGRAYCADSY